MNSLKPSTFIHPVTLDDEKLVTTLQETARTERQWQVRGLIYLAELEKRRVHLKLGYRSLYEFCVCRLRWSEGSIYRRIQIARKARTVPALIEAIRDQRLTMTVASQIAPHLTPDNAARMIGEYCGLTRRQAEDRLACAGLNTNGKGSARESVRSLGLHPVAPQPRGKLVNQEVAVSNPAPVTGPAPVSCPGPASVPAPTTAPANEPGQEIVKEEVFSFRFVGKASLRGKLERAKAVMVSRLDNASMESVLEAALDCLLDKHDPKRKAERARKRKARAEEKTTAKDDAGDKGVVKPKPKAMVVRTVHNPQSSYIPASLRMKVLERAGYQCEWKTYGRRCTASGNLQMDHRVPFGKGGLTIESNVQALCKAHNLLKARLDYGDGKIDLAIHAERGLGVSDRPTTSRISRDAGATQDP